MCCVRRLCEKEGTFLRVGVHSKGPSFRYSERPLKISRSDHPKRDAVFLPVGMWQGNHLTWKRYERVTFSVKDGMYWRDLDLKMEPSRIYWESSPPPTPLSLIWLKVSIAVTSAPDQHGAIRMAAVTRDAQTHWIALQVVFFFITLNDSKIPQVYSCLLSLHTSFGSFRIFQDLFHHSFKV